MTQLSIAAVFAVLSVFVHGVSIAPRGPPSPPAKALYFITNQQTSGQIAALPISPNGSVSAGTLTPLGSGGPPANQTLVGSLSSQYSIIVVGNLLFSVNAGSNTLNMFMIDVFNPTKLMRVGDAVTTGQFPISVAVSVKNSLVCVATAGDLATASCATYNAFTGVGQFDAERPYFTPATLPATGQFNTVGNVFFNEAETVLYTAIKGNTAAPFGRTFLSAFPVVNGTVSRTQTTSVPAGVQQLYGSQFVPGTDKIFTSGLGIAAVLDADTGKDTGTTQFATAVPNNTCLCWTAFSATTGTGFVSDPLDPSLVEVDLDNSNFIGKVAAPIGMLDIAAAGDYVYALTVGDFLNETARRPPSVVVFDVSGGRGTARVVQEFRPEGGVHESQGLALFV